MHVLVHIILKNWLFRSLRDGVERTALRLGPDMAVAFHHFLGDVAGDTHDGLVACLPLGQLRDRGMPQVVKAALEAGPLESIAPGGTPSFGWPRRINLPVLARREDVVLGIGGWTSASVAFRTLQRRRRPDLQFSELDTHPAYPLSTLH